MQCRKQNTNSFWQKKAAEKKEKETKAKIIQVDDLLTFRQFSKKAADDVIDVCHDSSVGMIDRSDVFYY